MKAVILVGGKGTRMKSVSQKYPKCLLEVAKRPVLDYILDCCEASQLIKEVILVTYHDADKFENYCKNKTFNKPLYTIKEAQALGTAGAMHSVSLDDQESCLILYGDIVCSFDIDRFIKWHNQKQAMVSVLVHPNDHPYDSDLIICNKDHKVINVIPKPRKESSYYPNSVNAACYVLKAKIKDFIPSDKASDFGRNILPKIYKNEAVFGYHTTAYLKDMGTPERIKQVEQDILMGKLASYHESQKRHVVFLDRDGVINKDTSFIKTVDELNLYSFSATAIKHLNRAGFLVLVITNQSVIARGLCTEETLEKIHNKMETLLGESGAFVDKIYYCPHHPDKGFPEENTRFKINCECRKPKIGMIKRACEEFNIDLSNSFLIGDSERDIQCGKTAGVTTIGVKTGNAVKGSIKPDIMCDNLSDAVATILAIKNK